MENKKQPLRNDISAEFKWNIEKIYADDQLWQADFDKVKTMLLDTNKYRGRLSESKEVFLDFLKYQDQLFQTLEKVFVYAAMRRDEDNTVPKYQAMRDNIESLAVEVSSSISFLAPELLAMPQDLIDSYLQDKEIALYSKYINEITRMREHTLSPSEEMLLAQTGEMAAAFDNIYSMLADADLVFPEIVNAEGEKQQLTHGNYVRLLQNKDRNVRKQAFDAMYDTYGKYSNTIACIFASSVKKDAFYARCRKYDGALAASLDGDKIPVAVYKQLIATVRQHQADFCRYLDIRRRYLDLDQLHMYDVYTPLLPQLEQHYSYDQAKEIIPKALSPLGEAYQADLIAGINGGWVDVYENKGKTSGAYSSGCYGTDPYILLNYQDNLNGLFTLAHEAGHSMHSLYSHRHQPYVYSSYRIFVAEVASTVNENLLIEYMLQHTTDEQTKLALINHFLEEFRGTVFRQTMFSEFEMKVHELASKGDALTAQTLDDIYYQLNCDYFGSEMLVDQMIAKEWMRIPHFYRSFYVYKYATGFSAACALAQGLLDPDPAKATANREKYLRFLSSGSSDDPIELLKAAGVDMTKSEPIEAAMALFNSRLDLLEKGIK